MSAARRISRHTNAKFARAIAAGWTPAEHEGPCYFLKSRASARRLFWRRMRTKPEYSQRIVEELPQVVVPVAALTPEAEEAGGGT